MNQNAHILDQKIELIQWLSTLEDSAIIERLIQFRKSEVKDFWESTSASEKASIEKGIEDADKNELTNHSSVRTIYEKWL